jgi:hypothetical protein
MQNPRTPDGLRRARTGHLVRFVGVAAAVPVLPRATPFGRRLKRDQRARANLHLARAIALLLQFIVERLAEVVGLAKLRDAERQARRGRKGSGLGVGFRHARLHPIAVHDR